MSANELLAKVRELKELKAWADELAQDITALEDAIKAEMTARDAEEMSVGAYKIRWAKITSSRFDTTAFKREMPQLYGRYTKTSETRRFTIN